MSFPSYASYIPTKMSCCDRIPIDWKKLKLRRIIQLKSGEFITAEKIDSTGEYPVYGGNGLRGYTKEYTHVGEYVLVGRQGALCGNVNYAEGEFWASEHALVAHPLVRINTHWLGELLRSMNLGQYSLSAAQPGLSVERILDLEIPFPKFYEQQSIAAFLDYETAKIDALIAEQQRLIELLKEKRQAVISHAVTKGLNPNAPMKDSGVEWLGEVPAHWVAGPMKYAWDVVDCKHLTADFIEEGIPLASIGEVQGRFVELSRAKKTTEYYYDLLIGGGRKPHPGDLIFSRNATVGAVAEVPESAPVFAMGQDVCLLKKRNEWCSSQYYYFVFHSCLIMEQLELLMVGATFRRINVEQIRNLAVPIPPEEEQVRIAKYVSEIIDGFDSMTNEACRAEEILKERRSALISAAVTGKIDVRGWQPSKASSPEPVLQAAEEAASYG